MNSKIIEIACSQIGIKEDPGPAEHNPEILKYFQEIGLPWVRDDETAWCSAFANWVAMKAGVERSGKLNARSWLNVGENIEKPMLGDIVVSWRVNPQDWRGHVGFYMNHDDKFVYILGGNQNNQVCVKAYDINKLLCYRRLKPKV